MVGMARHVVIDRAVRAQTRTTAALYLIGSTAAALLSVEAIRTAPPRGAGLLVMAVAMMLAGPALALWGSRLPAWTPGAAIGVGGAALCAGTAYAPSLPLAVAAAAMTALLTVAAIAFLPRRLAWALVLVVAFLQVLALAVVHDAPLLLCASLLVLWMGLATATGLLATLASRADVDALTGLVSRRAWDRAWEQAVARADRRGEPLSVGLIDLDHFKLVNDARGHDAGDDLLRAVARSWLELDLPGVLIGRRGGDEFAVLMPGRTADDARQLTDLLCHGARARASAGVAEYATGESASEVLRRADSALYAAKSAGRGRTSVSARADDPLAPDLARALDGRELTVALQPVVDLGTGAVIGVEALTRWRHERLGPIAPDVFIPLAERAGLIGQLGAQTLEAACADVARLEAAWGTPLHLGVNASGLELTDPTYADRVIAALDRAGRDPRELRLEVTESLIDASGTAAIRTLTRLRAAGVLVALDDFGTGWSTFSRLDRLPIDGLKLDRSFIVDLADSPRRSAMVAAVVKLCAELGIGALAEGVETAEQAHVLRELGCPQAQGFYFGRPAGVAELTAAQFSPRASRR